MTAFVGGRLIDGRGGDPIDDAVILVEDGRIAAVGSGEAVRLRGDVQRVDLAGLTVLPGLIDSHVHLVSEIRTTQVEHSERLSERMYRGIPYARRTLEAGVTTARDAGMTPAGMRIAIDDGIFPGPRLLVSVNIVSQTGGHGDWTLASGLDPGWITSDLPRGHRGQPRRDAQGRPDDDPGRRGLDQALHHRRRALARSTRPTRPSSPSRRSASPSRRHGPHASAA